MNAAAAIAASAAVWVLRTDYQPLFTELDPRDASAIAAELDRMKVPYVIGEDGTILVDRNDVFVGEQADGLWSHRRKVVSCKQWCCKDRP